MYSINEIFRAFGPEYMASFGASMPNEHNKVIKAIIQCRTEACGMVVYKCNKCGVQHTSFRSCGNRHCPACQNHKTKQWVEGQMKRQLPGHHFMITFTVPEQLRRFIRSNQRTAYAAMFMASSQTLIKLTPDPKFIGGDLPGFFGVLHTWGRQLQYHPHIHYIVPGGAILKEDGSWHPSRKEIYLPVKAMSKIFRAKFCDEMKKAELLSQISPNVWKIDWNVNSQAIGSSKSSIKYLDNDRTLYFKVAISDHRIVKVKVEDRVVFIRYKKTGSERWRTMELDAMEFLRRFLQHVLPTGFMKVRYYGFLSPSSSISLDQIRELMETTYGIEAVELTVDSKTLPDIVCPTCGGILKYCYSVLPHQMVPQTPG